MNEPLKLVKSADEGRIDPCYTRMSGTGSTTDIQCQSEQRNYAQLNFIWNHAFKLNVGMHALHLMLVHVYTLHYSKALLAYGLKEFVIILSYGGACLSRSTTGMTVGFFQLH